MPDPVNRRSYDATSRRAASTTTRQRVLDATRTLMVEKGYRATTVAAIATTAGVNPDTVYALIGRKPELLRELVEQAISGLDHAVAAEQRDYVQAIRAEPTAAGKITLYATSVCHILQRLAPLFRVVREAAPSEPDVAALWRSISDRRAANMRLFVADLAAVSGLRPGVTIERGADIVWTLNSSEVFLLLVHERGWSAEDVAAWLSETWQLLLLPLRP